MENLPTSVYHCTTLAMHRNRLPSAVGRINLTIPNDLEQRLRIAIVERGGKKGGIQEAAIEAFEAWLKRKH